MPTNTRTSPKERCKARDASGDRLCDRIRILRERSGLTLELFAAKCHVGVNTVRDWINARNLPRGEHLYHIAEEMNVRIDWVLFGSPERMNRNETRERVELETDLATHVQWALHMLESKGEFDEALGFRREAPTSWYVDGAGLLQDLVQREVQQTKDWGRFNQQAWPLSVGPRELLRVAKDLAAQLPNTLAAGDAVAEMLNVATGLRDLEAAIPGPSRPRAFKRFKAVDLSHSRGKPRIVIRRHESEIREHSRAQKNLSPAPSQLPQAGRTERSDRSSRRS